MGTSSFEEQPTFTWQQPFSKETVFWIVSLLGLLVVQWCGFKCHKLYLMTHADGGELLRLLVPVVFWDILLLVPVAFFFACWLEWTEGPARRMGLVSLHLLVLVGLIAATVEHRFFTITHALVNWEMLVYGIKQFRMLSDMIKSQFNIWTVLLLLLPMLILLTPLVVLRSAPMRRWREGGAGQTLWRSPVVWGALTLGWIVLYQMHTTPLSRDAQPLRKNFAAHWVAGILQSSHAGQRAVRHIKFDRSKLLFDAQRLRFVPTPKTRKPNVVVIILESMRWRSTTMAQPSLQTTPFLAKIAKKSLVVKDLVPVIPHTSKALVAILCGIYPKVVMDIVEAEVGGLPARCLPSLLKPLGYESAIFHPGTMRFENHDQLFINMGFKGIFGREQMPSRGFFRTNYFGYEDRIMLKPSLKWVDRVRKQKKPFFLTLHYLTSHHKYNTPPAFKKRPFKGKPGSEYNDYLNALRYIDDFTKDLFAGFRKRGMMEDTIFVLVSDHGEAFGEHKRYQHDNSLWQEVLKIPVMIYSPKYFPKGGVIEGPRQQTDILPTIADALRVKIKDGRLPGHSLFDPPKPKRERYLSCWYQRFCLAKMAKEQKFIFNYRRASMEMYDLKNDPKEGNDLSNSSVFRKKMKQAKMAMLKWKAQVNYVYETPDPHGLSQAVREKMPRVDRFANVDIGPWIRLVGVQRHTRVVHPGEPFDVTLVFKARRPMPKHWRFFFHLITRGPRRLLNMDHVPVGGRYPFSKWRSGQYILDRYRISVPPDFPPGAPFRVVAGLWFKGHRAPLKGPGLSKQERKSKAVVVLRGRMGKPLPGPDGRPPLERLRSADFGKYLRFGGYNLHSRHHRPGRTLDMTMVFRALRPIPKGWRLFVHFHQTHPHKFLNVTSRLSPKLSWLDKWKPGRFYRFRLKARIPKSFNKRRKLRVIVGIWHKKKPKPRISAPKEERKVHKRGHLIVLEESLR